MISAHTRRSLRELTRRKARSLLTILTIAGAVAGIWLFSDPGKHRRLAVRPRRRRCPSHNSAGTLQVLDLPGPVLEDLRTTDNVAAARMSRTLGRTEMRVGDRPQHVVLVGVARLRRPVRQYRLGRGRRPPGAVGPAGHRLRERPHRPLPGGDRRHRRPPIVERIVDQLRSLRPGRDPALQQRGGRGRPLPLPVERRRAGGHGVPNCEFDRRDRRRPVPDRGGGHGGRSTRQPQLHPPESRLLGRAGGVGGRHLARVRGLRELHRAVLRDRRDRAAVCPRAHLHHHEHDCP